MEENQTRARMVDQEIETDEIEYWERATTTNPPKNKKLQVDMTPSIDIENLDLSGFLQRVMPLMETQLDKTTKAFQYYEVEWGVDNDLNNLITTLSGPNIEEELKTEVKGDEYFRRGEKVFVINLAVSCFSWNCRGTSIAVGYTREEHRGWCPHKSYVRIWTLFKREQKYVEIEVESCLTALSFHPTLPNILAGGTYNGQMMLWDLDKNDPYKTNSIIDEYQHREAITSLLWAVSPVRLPQLFSISTDGKILQWNYENLEFPLRGFILKIKSQLDGGLSFSIPHEEDSTIIAGSEAGRIMKLTFSELNTQSIPMDGMKWKPEAEMILNNLNTGHRQQVSKAAVRYAMDMQLKEVEPRCIFSCKPDLMKMYANPITFHYENHDGPVLGIVCNPFHRNLFGTCSSDGTIRLYHLLTSKPLLTVEPNPNKRITAISWSETRPLVLAGGSDDGTVYIYDFLQNQFTHVATLKGEQRSKVTGVAFNKAMRDYLGVSYISGEVKVFQLSPVFTSSHPDEHRRLLLLLEHED